MTFAQLKQLLGGIGVFASLIYVAMCLISGGHALGGAVGAENVMVRFWNGDTGGRTLACKHKLLKGLSTFYFRFWSLAEELPTVTFVRLLTQIGLRIASLNFDMAKLFPVCFPPKWQSERFFVIH